MRTQIFAVRRWVRRMPGNRVEFVVSHDRLGRSSFDHPAHGRDTFQLLASAIDKVAYEYRTAIRMSVCAVSINVPKFVQQGMKLVRLTVYVSNDVVCHFDPPFVFSCIMHIFYQI